MAESVLRQTAVQSIVPSPEFIVFRKKNGEIVQVFETRKQAELFIEFLDHSNDYDVEETDG